MATIYPFQPYRYTAAAGDLNNLVTQPYDKISPAMQARYLALSPHNLVRVILGQRFEQDTESDNVYTRSAGYLNDWSAQGILAKEDAPSLYVYFQDFSPPDSDQRLTRKGFIGLGKLEEYSAGIVHRHEQTLSGPKKDRTELLNHTKSHFGQIFMLYPDREGSIDSVLDEIAADGPPDAVVDDEYGAAHRLWRVSDPAQIASIQSLMAGRRLLIADGHHRYETALAYRNAHPELEDAKAVMMTFVNMYSDGLRILATHRVLNGLADLDPARLMEQLGREFSVTRFNDPQVLRERMESIDPAKVRIGIAAGSTLAMIERDRAPGELDIRILHDHLLGDVLGISEEEVRDEKYLRYYRGIEPTLKAVAAGDAQLAFLLQPTPIEQVAEVSFGGGVMPQKSTDFYPKLLSGLTIYRLEE